MAGRLAPFCSRQTLSAPPRMDFRKTDFRNQGVRAWLMPRSSTCCWSTMRRAFREVMAERLAEAGYRVEQAASGEEALQRLNEFAFDILVTDLRLPGSGWPAGAR